MNITNLSKSNGKDPASILNFTSGQLKAYNGLLDFINASYDPKDYKRALIGAAGTGKTYLLTALIKNCNLSYSTIGLAAPTHKACRVLAESINIPNVNINTLQSDLGLRLNFDVENFDIDHPPFDPKGKVKIDRYSLYIIDEASMINRSLLTFLEKICKTNRCKIIYVGDESQLPPVKETYSPSFKGVVAYSLTQTVRQGDDNPVSKLLDKLRYDIKHKTFTFLDYIVKNKSEFNIDNTKGFQVCNSSEFNNFIYTNFNDEELTRNVDFAKVIAYTNNCVSFWNKFIRNSIIKDADKSIITRNDLIISYVTIVNKFNECVIKNSEEYIIKEIVNYVHPTYQIKGFMVKFTAIHGGNNTLPLFVVDHNDPNAVRAYANKAYELINSAKTANIKLKNQKWKEYFSFKESCLLLTNIANASNNSVLYYKDLDYGFSLTAHKSQGSTFDTVFVDVNDMVFDKYGKPYTNAEDINRRLYVACSRCKNKLYLKYGN